MCARVHVCSVFINIYTVNQHFSKGGFSNDYQLRTLPPSGLKVILKGVAIGAQVGGILLALALSLTRNTIAHV